MSARDTLAANAMVFVERYGWIVCTPERSPIIKRRSMEYRWKDARLQAIFPTASSVDSASPGRHPMKPKSNHNADIKNPNRGTEGTNITWDKAQGNRGKQMNPNQQQPNRPRQIPAPPKTK